MSDEMDVFTARLKAEVKRAGGRKAFSDLANIPLSTLNSYLAGVEPKVTMVVRIARALGLSVAQLLERGDADRSSGTRTIGDSEQIRMLNVVASAGPGYQNDDPVDLRMLPFARSVLADLGVKLDNARFLVARGDSMEPTISDGSIVLVDVSFNRPKDDGIYVVVVGNEVRIKRVARGFGGSVTLVSDNERYPTETLAPPEAEGLRVAGKVVWAGGRL